MRGPQAVKVNVARKIKTIKDFITYPFGYVTLTPLANRKFKIYSLKSTDSEFTQYRCPVSVGPSSKTCPK